MSEVGAESNFEWHRAESQFLPPELEPDLPRAEAVALGSQLSARLQDLLVKHPQTSEVHDESGSETDPSSREIRLERYEYAELFAANHLQDYPRIWGWVSRQTDGHDYAYLEAEQEDGTAKNIEISPFPDTPPLYFTAAVNAHDEEEAGEESNLTSSTGMLAQDILSALEQSATTP